MSSDVRRPLEPALLTSKEAAKYLAIGERTLRRLAIRRVKIGVSVRYAVSDLDLFIALHATTPALRKSA